MKDSLRKVEVLTEESWKTVSMKDLRVNDIFRMYDNDVLVENTSFVALSEPYVNEHNVWAIEAAWDKEKRNE